MDSEERFFLYMAGIIVGGITSTILGVTALCTYQACSMAKLGYQEVSIVGHSETAWQKPQ